MISLNLNEYRSVKAWRWKALITEVVTSFQEQLTTCPRSIFILDEIQSIAPEFGDQVCEMLEQLPSRVKITMKNSRVKVTTKKLPSRVKIT